MTILLCLLHIQFILPISLSEYSCYFRLHLSVIFDWLIFVQSN